MAWNVSVPAGTHLRIRRAEIHQPAHGTGDTLGRSDEWYFPCRSGLCLVLREIIAANEGSRVLDHALWNVRKLGHHRFGGGSGHSQPFHPLPAPDTMRSPGQETSDHCALSCRLALQLLLQPCWCYGDFAKTRRRAKEEEMVQLLTAQQTERWYSRKERITKSLTT